MTQARLPAFSAADFRRRVRERAPVADAAFAQFGDHRLNPDIVAELTRARLREAAVLVPVVAHPGEASIILTRRTQALKRHSGQIAFPGGVVDPDDASHEAAAMREAEEEIGLGRDHVDPVGRLPPYLTMTGFRIVPVLSVVRPGFALDLNPHEVDAVFEVPLSFLMQEANHRRESRVWQGARRHYYTMPYGDWFIWGVTAGIVRTLYERFYA